MSAGQLRIGGVGTEAQEATVSLLRLTVSRYQHNTDDTFRRYWREGADGELQYFWVGESGAILLGYRHLTKMERLAHSQLLQRLDGKGNPYDTSDD